MRLSYNDFFSNIDPSTRSKEFSINLQPSLGLKTTGRDHFGLHDAIGQGGGPSDPKFWRLNSDQVRHLIKVIEERIPIMTDDVLVRELIKLFLKEKINHSGFNFADLCQWTDEFADEQKDNLLMAWMSDELQSLKPSEREAMIEDSRQMMKDTILKTLAYSMVDALLKEFSAKVSDKT